MYLVFAVYSYVYVHALLFAAQVSLRPEAPTSVWPSSVAGWFGVLVSFILVSEKLLIAARGGKKQMQQPIFEKIDELKQDVFGEAKRLETEMTREIESFKKEVYRDVNGIGQRANEAIDAAKSGQAALVVIGERMLKSEIDRQAIHNEIARVRAEVQESSRMAQKSTRIARKQIIQAIARLTDRDAS
jgi:hypothetical protein